VGLRVGHEGAGSVRAAYLESEIHNNMRRGIAQERPGGRASTASRLKENRVTRAGKTILMVLGLAAGIAGVGRGMGWGQATGAAAPASGAAPAQAASPDSSTTTLQVFSRETVVDVTVTDAKGEPVRGLQASDFTMQEDGKPQAIRGFHEYSAKDAPGTVRMPPPLPANVYTNLQPAPASSAVNILLLDALNTASGDQVYMKQESLRYLRSMPKGTRIAVLGLSSRLTILQGLTSDPAILLAAVDTKKNRALPSPFIDNDTGDTIDSLMDIVDDGAAATLAEFENEQATFQQDMRNRMTLEALNQIAAYVSSIKGRKNLIWFGTGLPLNIFPDGGINDLQGMTDYSKDLRKTTDLLTAAEVAVYPVDARGLFNDPANSAATQGKGLTGPRAAQKAANDAAAKMKFLQKTAQEHLSMETVAEATGGQAYYNTNDLKAAVSKAIENGANYYTISYVPPSLAYDGRYHSIDVKVGRPDVHLGYRKGYNADDIASNAITPELTLATTAPEPYGNNMAASMGRGVPTSTQLLFTVRVEPTTTPAKPTDPPVLGALDPKLTGKELVRYDFQYVFPARQLTFSPGPDGAHNGSVEFDVAAYDVYGKKITTLSQTIKLPLTAEQYKQLVKSQTPFQFFQQLDLPPGEMFVRVGVLDGVSDKVGTTEIPLTVHKKSAGATAAPGGKGGD
jgi:VWFA-related protein